MKFIDLDGRIHGKNIDQYVWNGESRSDGQTKLGEILKAILPYTIYTEVPCYGTGLYMDFFIPKLNMCIEFDGRQHDEYVKFFHGSRAGYSNSVKNDTIKHSWCRTNGIFLLRLNNTDLQEEIVKRKIYDATRT